MKVKAAPGVRVPMDGAPRKYITDAQEVDVDATPYYLLRLKDRDLIRVDESTTDTTTASATQGSPATAADTAPQDHSEVQ